MALINTIREKSGVAVGAVAIGMLLFIVGGDLIGGRNRLFGRDEQMVGEVNGEKIELPEFTAALEQAKQNFTQQQGRPPDDQALSYLREQTWNQLLARRAYQPEFDKLGLQTSDEEIIDLVQGDNISPSLKQAFTDPKTGQFDKARLIEYLKNLDKLPPESQAAFRNFEASLREFDRPLTKYTALLKNSVYVTSAEAKRFDDAQNAKASFRYLFVPYTSVSDSAVKPTDAQLQDYLDRHKGRYKVEDGRSIEYIVIPEVASKEDSAAIRQNMDALAQQFRTAPNDSLFAKQNTDPERPYNHAFLSPADLPEKLRQQLPLKVGQVYGPYAENGTYSVYKVQAEKAGAKPAARASHILIKPTAETPEAKAEAKAKAQDILNKIKAGADFATMARQFGSDGTKEQGGDLGWFDESRMVPAFSKAVFATNSVGLLPNLVETNFGYHIVKVTAPKTNQTYQLAAIVKAVQPSEATQNATYDRAQQLKADAPDLEAFRQLVTKDKTLQKQEAKYVDRAARSLGTLPNAREIVRWAYGYGPDGGKTNVGDVQLFDIGDQHILAALTDTREKGTATVASIKPELTAAVRNELKAKQIIAKLQGKNGSLEDLAKLAGPGAQVQTAEGVAQSQGTIPGVGYEPEAIGRAFALKPGQKSAPIQGEQGVLVVEGTSVTPPATPGDVKTLRTQLAQQRQQRQDGLIYEAIKAHAEVKDNRSKFF
ncbi:peptidylprolyl isomerase [Hymenobacter setariae]|uniref:Periplasmic chaperone PpiD n=1 Tax=Hymenobacter setariae TaxID=2594794 RepID=A0A558BXK4_9BACT|nr:SurA N-terminal domain-containing protein [Hymenobacter setariae]TVT41244.1 peptidylprolyl isomerase [Hymenobacter setariae]